jgi:hypothetical protein
MVSRSYWNLIKIFQAILCFGAYVKGPYFCSWMIILLFLFRYELWHEQCCIAGLKLHMGSSFAKIDDTTWCPHRGDYRLQLKSAPQLNRFWDQLQCEKVVTCHNLSRFDTSLQYSHEIVRAGYTKYLLFVLCGSDVWSLTLREEHKFQALKAKYSGKYLVLIRQCKSAI